MGRLTAIVLGSAAGGGFPQWNCRCPVCQLAWAGDRRVRPRTQASLAVSANGEDWVLIKPGQSCALPGGLQAELFAVPGKVPLYLENDDPETMSEDAGTVGVELSAGGARLVYIPGAAAVTGAMRERLAAADVIFFDGTLFRDDEMIAMATGYKTGRRMGHMSINGRGGSLAA